MTILNPPTIHIQRRLKESLTPSKATVSEQSGAVVPEEKKAVVAKKKPAKKKGSKK